MKLKKAIKRLQGMQKDRKKFAEDEQEMNSIFMEDYEAIEAVLSELERLQEENEGLKIQRNAEPILLKNRMYFIDSEAYRDAIETMRENYIPKQRIKDKIEELKKDKDSKYYYMFLEERDIENTIEVLKEILKEDKII